MMMMMTRVSGGTNVREELDDEWMVGRVQASECGSWLVTIMQTKLEVSGLANQLFFFIRLEVPPLNYSLEVDSWV